MSDKVIYSKVLGELIQYKDIEDWFESKKIEIPFFDSSPLPFILTLEGNDFTDDMENAISNFLSLGNDERLKISDLVYKNCREVLDNVELFETDKPMLEIADNREIWKFVRPSKIYVSRRSTGDKDVYIQISCGCNWEEEHGLQLVFRQGKKITRVSDIDGHLTEADAYGKPDEEDKLLSEFEL
jgi:hypothetical protein